jgi:hypothetical protein
MFSQPPSSWTPVGHGLSSVQRFSNICVSLCPQMFPDGRLDLPGGRPSRCHLPACDRGRDSITMSSSAKNSATAGAKLCGRGQVSAQFPIPCSLQEELVAIVVLGCNAVAVKGGLSGLLSYCSISQIVANFSTQLISGWRHPTKVKIPEGVSKTPPVSRLRTGRGSLCVPSVLS